MIETETQTQLLQFVGFALKRHEKGVWVLVTLYQLVGKQDYWLHVEEKYNRPDIAYLRRSLGEKRLPNEIANHFDISNKDFSVLKDKLESRYKTFDWHWNK